MEGWKLRNRISVASGSITKMNGKFVPAQLQNIDNIATSP